MTIILLFANNLIHWLRSPDFVRPDPGPDPYPYLYVLRVTEAVSVVLFLYIGNHVLLQPWIKNGYPSLDGKMFIGGFFASTLDILFAIFNPTWAMNAYRFSYGSWANPIPGWPSPGAHKIPWGLLWCLPAYIWLGVGAAIFGCEIFNLLRRKFPRMDTMTMYIVG